MHIKARFPLTALSGHPAPLRSFSAWSASCNSGGSWTSS